MGQEAGWIEGKNWINEYEIPGMPNKSEVGVADYVLMGDDGRILAVIEAKRTCVDVSKERQQAKLYADLIAQKQGCRPVVFLTNGFETHIVDNQYPERKCATIYSKRDMEKLFNLQSMRSSLKYITTDKNIAGRYYQEGAIKACDSFVNLLPDLSVTNLCEEKDNYTAHGVFSTYQTMMNCIDSIHYRC